MRKLRTNPRLASAALILVFLSLFFNLQFCKLARANPIPFPTLIMPEEYINVTVSPDKRRIVSAEVNGLYPFRNVGHKNVTMYYPVPSDSSEISVMMNETALEWKYSDENYSTVIGEFPMIEWVINPLPESFQIRTHYYYAVPKDGSYSFLYAMGTGRYLESYAKETTAYVSMNISKEIVSTKRAIDVHTIGYNKETERWLWKPANYTVNQDNDAWLISLVEVSGLFRPLVDDLLVTIKPCGSASDVNDGVKLTISMDRTAIVIGEVVNITLTVRNVSNHTIGIQFGSTQFFDIYLHGMGSTARWSDGKVFLFIVSEVYLDPNQTFTRALEWNFFLYDRNTSKYTPPDPGMYDIIGICVGYFLGGEPPAWSGILRIELELPDVNHDRKVNVLDIAIGAKAYGSHEPDVPNPGDPPSANWNAIADLNNDGVINIKDIQIIAVSFGKTC